jgi:hypothetical protein
MWGVGCRGGDVAQLRDVEALCHVPQHDPRANLVHPCDCIRASRLPESE